MESTSIRNPFLDEMAILFRSFAIPSEISIHDDANSDNANPTATLGIGFTSDFLKYLCPIVFLSNINVILNYINISQIVNFIFR